MMIPVARQKNLLIQEVGNELVLYDQQTNKSHCLNSVAACVWNHCNGQNSVEDIARFLTQELNIPANAGVDIRGLVYLSLEELEQYGLIERYLSAPTAVATLSRRTVVKTATLAGGFAIGSMFPLVKSIIAPTPAMASSTGGGVDPEFPPEGGNAADSGGPSAFAPPVAASACPRRKTISGKTEAEVKTSCADYCRPCRDTLTLAPVSMSGSVVGTCICQKSKPS
jgi:hypothetical protein